MTDWIAAGQIDPDIFRAFVDSIGIDPIVPLVRLKSGSLAVVVEQNAASAPQPRINNHASSDKSHGMRLK